MATTTLAAAVAATMDAAALRHPRHDEASVFCRCLRHNDQSKRRTFVTGNMSLETRDEKCLSRSYARSCIDMREC